ncbi:hypothetical protein RIF29_36476 [Crotalaria pallida]|uniref:Uncharacterized protein n=1 Tax=Crotalaria pallida TaxID=3830 RepID=A0AAN9ECA6_CROPI
MMWIGELVMNQITNNAIYIYTHMHLYVYVYVCMAGVMKNVKCLTTSSFDNVYYREYFILFINYFFYFKIFVYYLLTYLINVMRGTLPSASFIFTQAVTQTSKSHIQNLNLIH